MSRLKASIEAPGIAELLQRSRPTVLHGPRRLAEPVAGAEVATMLREAGAPAASCTAEAANFLALCMEQPLEFVSYRNGRPTLAAKEKKRERRHEDRTILNRVQDAVDTLGRDLPLLIKALQFASWDVKLRLVRESGDQRCERAEHQAALLDDFLGRLGALPRFSPPRRRTWWHLEAARFFDLYRQRVDMSATANPEGPAIRFIASALKRMGYRLRDRGTVANVLRRLAKDGVTWFDEAIRQSPDLMLDPEAVHPWIKRPKARSAG